MAVEVNDSEEEEEEEGTVNVCTVPSYDASGFLWGCIKVQILTANTFLNLIMLYNKKNEGKRFCSNEDGN